MQFVLKVLISALLIAGVSEVSKRSTVAGGILASLPLTSLLALTWLYWDTRDPVKVLNLSLQIFWAVIPSLIFFLILWALLKNGQRFVLALALSCVATALSYALYVFILRKLGVAI